MLQALFEFSENDAFLSEQIITYLGNKRSLLPFIHHAVSYVKERLKKEKLRCADLFSGSGVVSRYFKQYASTLVVNDLEHYTEVINRCYLKNRSSVDIKQLQEELHAIHKRIEAEWAPGLIAELYAPKNDAHIEPGERVFFSRRNAIYLDTARKLLDQLSLCDKNLFLAPLLYEASVHNNTSGVFKGFYKNKAGVGCFGGEGRNALRRILGEIRLNLPLFSNYECEVVIHRTDVNQLVNTLPELDLTYLDPPYNQHPYGANYFMLNLLVEYQRPSQISTVSGIPKNWNRSRYNKRPLAKEALFNLIQSCPSRFILISYNSEGFISYDEFVLFLSSLGVVNVFEKEYNTFRGCRNLHMRDLHVSEYLFLLERK
ncbi:MAG: DNA adenine methylase [Kiritimatiellae bacterium]|nr:DNA adenine methylase [Kiritimatiellia bacterium]